MARRSTDAVCHFRGCVRPAKALGLCKPHYNQLARNTSLEALRDPEKVIPRSQTRMVSTRIPFEAADALAAAAKRRGETLYVYLSRQLQKLAERTAA